MLFSEIGEGSNADRSCIVRDGPHITCAVIKLARLVFASERGDAQVYNAVNKYDGEPIWVEPETEVMYF